MHCEAQLAAQLHISIFYDDYKPSKLGQTQLGLVFGLWSESISLIGPCMQDYKSLRVAVMFLWYTG